MAKLDRSGVTLAWDDRGSGPPILLIMGHRYSSRMWYPVYEGLGDRYRLISFDNRGAGESGDRARTTVGELTDDALAVLNAAGVDKAHVYGVSMGGGIAIEFAIRYPERVRSIILGCTLAKTADKRSPPKWLLHILYRLPMPLLRLLQSKRFKGGYGDAASDEAIARDQEFVARDPFSVRGVLAQAMAISDYTVSREAVRAISAPTLVLHGDQDMTVPRAGSKELAELIPNARLVTFEGCGHNYFVGAKDAANAEVDRFIQHVEGAA